MVGGDVERSAETDASMLTDTTPFGGITKLEVILPVLGKPSLLPLQPAFFYMYGFSLV